MRDKNQISCHTKMAVIGLGYVGLPFAILAGQKGVSVLGIDNSEEKVANLRQGHSYIPFVPEGALRALLTKDMVQFSTDYDELGSCDVIVICVPTPLTRERRPDYSYLIRAVRKIAKVLRRGQLVVVESTVAPGTTTNLVFPLLEASGLVGGTDYFLAHSPERIDPGNTDFGIADIPKLVAGLTSSCRTLACRFYQQLGLQVVSVSTLAVAELAKLLENTYRDVNIALINEMAQVCRVNQINIWEVIAAAATKPFGFQPFYPGPGVGGHCVPVDSVYYATWARDSGVSAKLAEHARAVNNGVPQYVTEIITDSLPQKKDILDCKIMVLGVTYKKNSNDVRESPVIKIIELLIEAGAQVMFHDPNVSKISVNDLVLCCTSLEEEIIRNLDCVVLAVAHSTFDFTWIQRVSPVIVDLTNTLQNK